MIPEVTIEECAEVIQAITKIQRFGMENTGYNNKKKLEIEIGQLRYMLARLEFLWNLDNDNILKGFRDKSAALSEYAKYNTCNKDLAGT